MRRCRSATTRRRAAWTVRSTWAAVTALVALALGAGPSSRGARDALLSLTSLLCVLLRPDYLLLPLPVATPDEPGRKLLADAAAAMRLSARGFHRVLKVARTIADLAGAEQVGRIHVAEALSYRRQAPRN